MEDCLTFFVVLSEEQERILKAMNPDDLRALELRVARAMQEEADRILFSMFNEGVEPRRSEAPAIGFINHKVTS